MLLIRILILLIFSVHSYSYTTELTLQQAINTAKKHRPNLQALEYKIREEQLKVKEAWTGYLPKIQIVSEAVAASQQGAGQNGLSKGLNAGIQAQQLLYQFGGPQQQAKIAQAAVGIAQFDKLTQEQAIAYEVTKTFIDCWVLQQQQILISQIDKSSRQTFKQAQQLRDVQLLDKQDFLASVETRTFANEQVVNFQEDIALAQTQLTFLLGNNQSIHLIEHQSEQELTTLTFSPCREEELSDVKQMHQTEEQYIKKALTLRPELKVLDKKIEIEQQTATQAKLSTAPSVSLLGNSMHVGAAKMGQYSGSIAFSWPIFDGTRSRYLAMEANARATAAMLQKEQAAQQIMLEVKQACFLYGKSLNSHQAQRIAMKRADSLFNRRNQEFKLGLTTKTSLEEARVGLLQTKNRFILAQADIAQKEALLKYRCGDM
ncbi:TolC family protein [Candidatus Dependentiae bacterium]|nr:TolC family protein [Candidatus Dependentiae bacterium]